jgi:predicted O-methyltransferase YrrM
LTAKEAEFLYLAASNCSKNGAIVEIGSWRGKSTVLLAQGALSGQKPTIYAVDPHTGGLEKRNIIMLTFYEFKNNIKKAGADEIVVPIVKRSEDAVKGWNIPVEVIFIDGSHEFEDVEKDFTLWDPHVIEGGLIIFHDTNAWLQNGPYRAIKKHILKSRHFKDAGTVDSIFYARKCVENTQTDLENMARIERSLRHVDVVNFFYAPIKKLMCSLGFNVVDMSYAVYSPWTDLSTFNPLAGFFVRIMRRLKFNSYIKDEQGCFKEYYKAGGLKREIRHAGHTLHGVSKLFYENGNEQAEIPYNKGYIDGCLKEYYDNGKLRSEEFYVNGERDGLSKVYFENGVLMKEKRYSKNRMVSAAVYDENGKARKK